MTGLVALERHVIRSRSFLRKPSSVPTEFDEFCQELRTQIFKQYFGLLCGCTAHLPYITPKALISHFSLPAILHLVHSHKEAGKASRRPGNRTHTHTPLARTYEDSAITVRLSGVSLFSVPVPPLQQGTLGSISPSSNSHGGTVHSIRKDGIL